MRITMKKTFMIMMALFFFWTPWGFSEEKIVESSPTGDAQLDMDLKALNEKCQADLTDFSDRMNRYYGVPKEKTDWLLNKVGMSPGDAYMAAKVSRISKRPIEEVVEEYDKNRGKGWGVIAKNLGIQPGSEEFHALKEDDSGMVEKSKGKAKKEKKHKGKDKEKKGKKE